MNPADPDLVPTTVANHPAAALLIWGGMALLLVLIGLAVDIYLSWRTPRDGRTGSADGGVESGRRGGPDTAVHDGDRAPGTGAGEVNRG